MAEVPAHITGTVWKIEKKVGDEVKAGDVLVILESMKMEMPVEAPEDRAQCDDMGEPQPTPPRGQGAPHAGDDEGGDRDQIEAEWPSAGAPVRPLGKRSAEEGAESDQGPDADLSHGRWRRVREGLRADVGALEVGGTRLCRPRPRYRAGAPQLPDEIIDQRRLFFAGGIAVLVWSGQAAPPVPGA